MARIWPIGLRYNHSCEKAMLYAVWTVLFAVPTQINVSAKYFLLAGVTDKAYPDERSSSIPPHIEPPVFITEPPATLDYLNTGGALVSCSAYGSPAPVLDWVWAGTSTMVDDIPGLLEMKANGSLHFLPYNGGDIHEWEVTCVASNLAGTLLSRTLRARSGEPKSLKWRTYLYISL